MDKKEIRNQIKEIINLNKKSLDNNSERICTEIINSELYKKSTIIIAYMALPDEVNLEMVINKALTQGKTVFLPHVYPNTSRMDFFLFTELTPVVMGEFNIKEPVFKTTTRRFDFTEEQTLFLIPGRAFTKDGVRIGRGKGFYDIYMEPYKNKPNIIKAGVCFPFQIMTELPATSTDVKMDLLFY